MFVMGYFFGGLISLLWWLYFFLRDQSAEKTDRTTYFLLLMATLIWPVAMVGSYMELRQKSKSGFSFRSLTQVG
jgi:hypothetical protein